MEDNPWKTLSRSVAFEDGWISVEDRHVQNAAGQQQPYSVVRFKKIGVRILPIDQAGCTYLVGQHRYAADYFSWELPAGGAEPGEDLTKAAMRELQEEVGLSATQWEPLLDLVPSGSTTSERQVCFLAWGFEHVPRDPDPQEVLRVRRLPMAEAYSSVCDGSIRDGARLQHYLLCS